MLKMSLEDYRIGHNYSLFDVLRAFDECGEEIVQIQRPKVGYKDIRSMVSSLRKAIHRGGWHFHIIVCNTKVFLSTQNRNYAIGLDPQTHATVRYGRIQRNLIRFKDTNCLAMKCQGDQGAYTRAIRKLGYNMAARRIGQSLYLIKLDWEDRNG